METLELFAIRISSLVSGMSIVGFAITSKNIS